MDTMQIFIPILATFAVGGVFYAFVYPHLSGDAKAEKRMTALQSRSPVKAARAMDATKRKKQVADSLREIDARTKSKKITLETKIVQAGLEVTRSQFYIGSAVLGTVAGALAYLLNGTLWVTAAITVIAGAGLPLWILGFLRKRRIKRFLLELPNAVDIIVRGIKAGIPLGDCVRSIASEASEPVKSEFRAIVEAQAMGLTLAEAVERIVDRVPTAEANFFSIVINIQQKAGGNLAEALMNLSNVLRDRKKMRGKIKAMSSEAKASAGIIGCLPPMVALFVYLTSPAYIMLLFTTSTGHMVMAACAIWMSCGIFVMKKMISFDI